MAIGSFFHRRIISFLFASAALQSIIGAAVFVDQTCDTNPYFASAGPSPDASLGQSFTVGLDGTLATVEVFGWNQMTAFPSTRDHTLTLYSYGDTYVPANAIASITQTADRYSEHWFSFDFSQYNLQMQTGEKYLIMWTSSGHFNWRGTSDSYSGGERLYTNVFYPNGTFDESHDHLFRTYMTVVPEPDVYTLFLVAVMIFMLINKRRNERIQTAVGRLPNKPNV